MVKEEAMNDYRRRALKRLRMRLDKIIPISILIIIIAFFAVWYCIDRKENPPQKADENMLTVRIIDVGQGDAILICAPDGTDMLIDTGTSSSSSSLRLVADLREYCRGELEYLLLTHFDYDHIGGADAVFRNFDVGELIIPETEDSSALYRSLISSLENEDGCLLKYARPGNRFDIGEAQLTIISSPTQTTAGGNNDCIVSKLCYKQNSFLFTGDLEEAGEKALVALDRDGALDCDVLKVSHHGSATSTTEEFLLAVSPEIAVISCSRDNTFGHPSEKVLERLDRHSIGCYRTDLEGTITLQSDGTQIIKLK